MKASNRVLLSAGLGTSIAISGVLGIGIIPGAFADEPTTTAPTTSEGGASSVSTTLATSSPTSPTTPGISQSPKDTRPAPSGSATTTTPTEQQTTTDTVGQEASTAPSQPTKSPEPGSPTSVSPTVTTPTSSSPTASATDTTTATTLPAPVVDANVEIFWAMDKGATPDNVSWPQYYADGTFLQCGIWYQADTYLASEAPKYYADGQLDLGEDYQSGTQRGAISWRFVYGGDCVVTVPLQPHDDTRIVDDHETKDCEAGFVTRIVTEVTTTFVYQESDNTWNPVEQAPVTTSTTRPASEEECPVNTPPVATVPTTPSAPTKVPPLVTSGVAAITTATHGTVANTVSSPHTERLAQTGSNETMLYWFGGVLAALLLTLGVAGVVSGRRKNG